MNGEVVIRIPVAPSNAEDGINAVLETILRFTTKKQRPTASTISTFRDFLISLEGSVYFEPKVMP